MTIKNSTILPFDIKANSEVTGGYANQLHSEFAQETEITNYHEDDYRIGEKGELVYDVAIQGPFTNTWVGGRTHRHSPLNLGDDTAQTRPEAWHVTLLPNTIRLHSNAYLGSPPAYWTREEFAKRPVSIKNIQDTEKLLGNYSQNYEVLQTSGRRITNNLIVDGFIAGSSLTTQYITGANIYTLPDLTGQDGSKSIIVERFNAPGSKEESSRGALDREGEEMSPNIPLPFRNLKIRQPFYRQLSQHMPQFGSGSTYALLPQEGFVDAVTIHKVNRNRLVRAGNIQYDNWFVQHQIPRTDIQYSWITASALTTAEELGGFQPRDYVGRQAVNVGIDFISGSFTISGSNQEYFVDNLFINSLVKDTKQVNTETNTYSLSASLSSSVAEYVNSPYTYTSWVSMRNGENLIARTLRKENIVSIKNSPRPITYKTADGSIRTVIAKHGQGTTNFKEPPVTYKYKPLTHRLKFAEDTEEVFQIEHEYTNLLSRFANKDLNTKLLLEENETQFYDLLREQYKRSDVEVYYLGHSYKEIIWPKEENTGLKETRKRSEYYLGQPGFDRDGYDRQLGTQRAFWRDTQQDRKRSKNSEGGHYSSINYLSTEETGSSSTRAEEGVLTQNKEFVISSSYIQDSQVDFGLFNSIVLLETASIERNLFQYSASVDRNYTYNSVDVFEKYANINKNSYVFDVSGEFNNTFTDFYEQIKDSTSENKKSIGALYRNTSYKSLLTSLPKEKDVYDDTAVRLEDDELFANPKLKYVAFVGGGELNTSSYIQTEENFSNDSRSIEGVGGRVNALLVDGDSLYVAGDFVNIADTIETNRIARFNLSTEQWEPLSGSFNEIIDAVETYENKVYAGGNFTSPGNYVASWDGTSWSALSTGVNSRVYALATSGSNLYIGGDFTSPNLYLTKWEIDNEVFTASPIGMTQPVDALVVSGSDLYISYATSPFIAKMDTATNSTTGLGGGLPLGATCMAVSGSDIYVGGYFTVSGSSKIARWNTSTSTWYGLSTGISFTPESIIVSGSDIYVGGDNVVYRWNGSAWLALGDGLSPDVFALETYSDKVYAGGLITETGSNLSTWDVVNEQWSAFTTETNSSVFANDYFSQTFAGSSFSFSTLDNGLQRQTEQHSGKKPFFDSYEEFVEDIRAESKQYSILPEFKISEHMQYYVSEKGGNFKANNKKIFSLDGANKHASAESESANSYDETFIKTYTTSDILKKHDDIKAQNQDLAEIEKINLKISGIKKLLPYNGFYPQDRTVQLANLYSEYIDNNLHGGVYNLSYFNDYFDEQIIEDPGTGIQYSMDIKKFGDHYYMAVGYPLENSLKGRIRIFKSEANDPEQWSDTPVVILEDSMTYQLGLQLRLISATNGLNLFAFSRDFNGTTNDRFTVHSYSADGTTWSALDALKIKDTDPAQYVTGSFLSDVLYDTIGEEEKIIIAKIGSNTSIVTGTLSQNSWECSDNVIVHNTFASECAQIISCSSGYQMFFSKPEEFPDSIGYSGSISVVSSSNANSWSTEIRIVSGSTPPNTFGGVFKNYTTFKAVDYGEKSYLFINEPSIDIDGKAKNGAVFVISSSNNNSWGYTDTDSEKTLLAYGDTDLNHFTYYKDAPSSMNRVDAFSGSDGRLYYAFANDDYFGSSADYTEILLGNSTDGISWQTKQDNEILSIIKENERGGSTISSVPYNIGSFEIPIFFSTIGSSRNTQNIYAFKNNQFTNFTLKVSGSEKYYKHAALEPFMAPGILYNTIKSGLAVDWPCATGSNTAIVPYGGDTIVNAYYPKSFEMASFSGSNIYESMYGQVRSNIDYRIPFENILFPNEAFIEKTYQEEDLVSRTVLSTLDDDDPLVQFIDKTYIYGGYEPYISPIDFSDINNLGPKRFSVPFVYKKKGSTDTGLYTLAMSNFLAETVKFFLKDEKMITFSSQPDYKWKQFDSNKTYYMDVILEKTPELTMMEAYHSDLHPTGSNGEKMNGRYFGYPVNKTDKALWGGAAFTEEESKLIHNDPAYAPYTPPYFEGVAKVRISFKPSGTSRAYTVQEIFDEATIENIFDDVAKGATTGSDAYVNKMPVGSSFDVFGSAQATEVTIDEVTGQQTVRELTDTQNWIISPRLETPVLDFSSQPLETYENDYSKTSGFGKGMWSGYGAIPSEGKGVKVRLTYPFAQEQASPLTASLLDQVGFKAEEKNVGQIADSKTISEAVVLVPYLEKEDSEYTIKNSTGFNFIKLSKKLLDNVGNGNIESESVSDMITKMEKYIIPPEMNFLQFSDIKPFVMYLFEFEHTLTQQDLADIWQGVMPSISQKAEKDDITISHSSGEHELFEGKEMPDNLRWLIFKVKKKAEKNYFNITATTKDDKRFNFNKIIGRETGTDIYSYNWPYDYFSLVEMAKVELKLDYKAKDSE